MDQKNGKKEAAVASAKDEDAHELEECEYCGAQVRKSYGLNRHQSTCRAKAVRDGINNHVQSTNKEYWDNLKWYSLFYVVIMCSTMMLGLSSMAAMKIVPCGMSIMFPSTFPPGDRCIFSPMNSVSEQERL